MNLKLKAISLSTLSLLIISSTHANIIRRLDDTKTLEVSISKQGLNRITVKDDRIHNVFGITGEYVLEADETLGHVFIRPLPGSASGKSTQPIHLTLTTEKGHTQDLRLIPQDQAPNALILEENNNESLSSKRPITRDEVEALVQACHEMRIPLGYRIAPIDLHPFKGISFKETPFKGPPLEGDPLKGAHRLVREIRGETLRALTFEVNNLFKHPLILSESDFIHIPHAKKRDIIAVGMSKKTLKPGESIHVHVITKL